MICHKNKIIFIHIPKTGGKTFLKLFGLPALKKDMKEDRPELEDIYGHKKLVYYVDRSYFHEYFKCAFIRNPYERLASAFAYLNAGGCNDGDENYRRQRLARYKGDFRKFVLKLHRHINHLHFAPQHLWVTDNTMNICTDFIGRMDTFDQDMRFVTDKIGITCNGITKENSSNSEKYLALYDDKMKAVVQKLYDKDFELFNFVR